MESHVPLERQFSPVSNDQIERGNDDISLFFGHAKPKTWGDIDHEYRCVILAEAGAGKTEELRRRARVLADEGKPSFFIRIEDIDTDFYKAFEVGQEAQFQAWLQSTEEAWFFLDSVDEARLESPRVVEKALRRFANSIKKGAHRAHIYLSSRPYAWRPTEDRRMFDELLFLAAQPESAGGEENVQAKPQSALTLYTMRPLDEERIRRFCEARAAKEIDQLLREVERANLWSLAERPFDLEGILAKWDKDKKLGGRLELLRYNIKSQLRDEHNSDRAQRQPLNTEYALEGARRLAAAVILTGKPGLNVPDATAQVKQGIEAEDVLADWDPKDVRVLLERGIFNDVIYDTVRFRHRDVRELLAAEWFDGLLKSDNSRADVEKFFFRDQYGEKIIAPRLRPVLPWLILFDDKVCRQALTVHPEIAVEGGDPSQLPLPIRQEILSEVVRRIASNEDDGSARGNGAIARIARADLMEDTKQLINAFADNDDAIFFLGRLVWQGEMASCVAPFVDIAVDSAREIYARIASARAVMTCGSTEQRQRLWQQGLNSSELVLYELLSVLTGEAEPNSHSVEQLLISLDKLPPYEQFESSDLDCTLHGFIECLSVDSGQEDIIQLLDGLHCFLDRKPYIEYQELPVSNECAWLLGPAAHAIERLVEARSSVVFGATILSIMLKVPGLRHWHRAGSSEYKNNLQALVPAWPELNDALYWASIEQTRAAKMAKDNEALINDWPISCLGHFWYFDTASLPRLLGYMSSRTLQDDRLVALSTAFRVYWQADKPAHILADLKGAVADDSVLKYQLDTLLNPPVSETMQKHEQVSAERQRKRGEEKELQKQEREAWIEELCADPDLVRNPPSQKPDELTGDQSRLMKELKGSRSATGGSVYENWQALIPDFGDAVAHAYRDAAVSHWQRYVPTLRSEEGSSNNVPNALLFAMAGLEIEAAEVEGFPANLNEVQVRHALRYITRELNGFPRWFECMHRTFPALVEEAVIKELLWELENTGPGELILYILHSLCYYAPWLHASMAPVILKWLETHLTRININRHDCLQILVKGDVEPARLVALADRQIAQTDDADSIPWWYALRVDCDPENGIPDVERWLSGLDDDMAVFAAQLFITTLMGDRHSREGGSHIGHFRTAEHLKSLYILMHRYIRVKEDNNRANGGIYSPELRDDAQDARNQLFNLLSEIPGKESYTLIKQLIHDHPDPDHRPWMAKQAYKRAEEDGDLEPWTAEQVNTFSRMQTLTPATHRQLFDLTVKRLQDLKKWLERGDFSAWKTWKRAEIETEMRTLIAGWLDLRCCDQYKIAQEPELANSQRMDIGLYNTKVQSPVPIELKLLDNKWSGPKLCERLRNQLAGDYLRESSAGCGVMLLVWQGNKPDKWWMINGRRVDLPELACALKSYWQDIAGQFPNVESIEVVVIDLTMRGKVSAS